MAKKKTTKSFTNKQFVDDSKLRTQYYEENLRLLEEEKSSLSGIFNIYGRITNEQEKLKNLIEIKNEKQDIYNTALKEQKKIHGNSKKLILENIKIHDKEIAKLEKKHKIYNNIAKSYKLIQHIGSQIEVGSFLMNADSAIKSINLELGLANQNALNLRSNISATAGYAARLGASTEDLANIQRGYTEETGRARVLSSQMLGDITKISQGTGIGVQNASQMAAQFELMGINGTATLDYMQGIVDTSERMGVSTSKVLKSVQTNFKQLQKYTFRGGVAAMAKMAQHAEKFNYSVSSMLDSAEGARTLEGAVKLAAELQVMGGEFARTDPFEMLFLSRNDPDKFAKKINNMTRGIATFSKNSKGVFENFIAPVDIDRLEQVGKALGMQRGELTEQARRMAEIQRMRELSIGAGYTKDEMQLIEGAAQFDSKSGRFLVQVAGLSRDIASLTKDELKVLEIRNKSLEERAIESQTFDKAYKNTIADLKSALIPALNGVNATLEAVRPTILKIGEIVNNFSNSHKGFMKVLGVSGILLFSAGKIVKGLTPMFNLLQNKKIINAINSGGGVASKGGLAGGGSAALGKGKGLGAARKGAGMAGLGIGVGIGAAAAGIGLLAAQMAKLDKTQIWALPVTVLALGGAFLMLTPAINALGAAGGIAAPGLYSAAGAIIMIGAGIGIAAAGIGLMGMGLGQLVASSKDAGWSLAQVGVGLMAVNAAMAMGGATAIFGGIGLATLSATLKTISKHSNGLNNVGESFKNIAVVMNGDMKNLTELEKTIKNISNISLDNDSALGNLAKLFNKPLKVEFSDKEVSLVSNIELKVDGYNIAKATYKHLERMKFTTTYSGTS